MVWARPFFVKSMQICSTWPICCWVTDSRLQSKSDKLATTFPARAKAPRRHEFTLILRGIPTFSKPLDRNYRPKIKMIFSAVKEFKTIQGLLSFAPLGLFITDCAMGNVNPSKQRTA
jgi:hypothetical protein